MGLGAQMIPFTDGDPEELFLISDSLFLNL